MDKIKLKEIEKLSSKIHIIWLTRNTGGAGGFYESMKYAMEEYDPDWYWLMDDDAYPDKNAIKYASEYLESKSSDSISAICGTVDTCEGIDLNHRRKLKKGKVFLKEVASRQEDYELDEFEINYFTYVCSIINAEKIKQVGSTNRDFFIYYDDSDHAARLNTAGKIICVPKIRAYHDVVAQTEKNDYTWKTYYLLRNRLYFYKFNFEPKYYKIERILIWLRIFKKRKKACTKLIKSAISDFNSNKMGLSNVYKPGTDINKI